MAFNATDLSVLAYANNFTLWHYTTEDNSLTTSGYFDDATGLLRANDLIIGNSDTDGTPSTDFYIVTGNTGSAVSVSAYA